jgi:hypothetical protein
MPSIGGFEGLLLIGCAAGAVILAVALVAVVILRKR